MLPQTASAPISSVLRDRRFALALAGGVGLHISLVALRLPSWECPVFRTTGVPCPGCGLTRAMMLLFQGELRASIQLHAFAPVFLVLAVVLAIITLLPKSLGQSIIQKTERFERRTALTVILLSGLILYWLARLLFLNSSFVQLIRG